MRYRAFEAFAIGTPADWSWPGLFMSSSAATRTHEQSGLATNADVIAITLV